MSTGSWCSPSGCNNCVVSSSFGKSATACDHFTTKSPRPVCTHAIALSPLITTREQLLTVIPHTSARACDVQSDSVAKLSNPNRSLSAAFGSTGPQHRQPHRQHPLTVMRATRWPDFAGTALSALSRPHWTALSCQLIHNSHRIGRSCRSAASYGLTALSAPNQPDQ